MSKLKAAGLLTAAALALAIAWAPAAYGASPEFHCTAETATCFITSSGGSHGTGSNDNEFITGSGTIACTGNTEVDGTQLKGTAEKTTTTLTLEATYTGCKAFGVSATVNMEGCTYKLHLVEGGTSPFPVNTDVVCPEGKSITITPTGLACTVTIGAQTTVAGVTLTNAPGTHVSTSASVTGLSYTETGAACVTPGTRASGKFNGTATLTAYEDIGGVKGPKVPIHVGSGATQEPDFHCTAETANCILSGSQITVNIFTTVSGTAKCETATYAGTAPKTTFMVPINPTFAGCKAFGLTATVKAEGCYFWAQLKEKGTSPYPATTSIFCPPGKAITINAGSGGCIVTIGEQTGLTGMTFENTGAEPTHLTATFALEGIKYTQEGTACTGGKKTVETGLYKGTTSLFGFEDSGGVEGKNVGLHVF